MDCGEEGSYPEDVSISKKNVSEDTSVKYVVDLGKY